MSMESIKVKATVRIPKHGIEVEVEGTPDQVSAVVEDLKRKARGREAPVPRTSKPEAKAQLDFTMSERHFVKTFGKGLSGPKKFALLVAYVCQGEVGREVALAVVERLWNRMTSDTLLGIKFNRFYPTTAKENGWVVTPKKGVYVLRTSWSEILNKGVQGKP